MITSDLNKFQSHISPLRDDLHKPVTDAAETARRQATFITRRCRLTADQARIIASHAFGEARS